ncbi:hypothetical protein D5S17_01620 [Pseudonocardiaceae bacterium YIM PH 21723]|nr:hypothetical protein D5S17_01620 [Pseudonocardiaceae bacterium YIM PH 21723]
MAFVQIIDYRTTRADEVQDLLSRWIELTGGKRTATRTTVGRDRQDPTHFMEILEFPSYEVAMANSALPETTRVHEEFVALLEEPPRFIDLDVIRSESL